MNKFYKIIEVIENAEKNNNKLIVSYQYNENCTRMYKSYTSCKEYLEENKYKNKHAFEILKKGDPCKLYLDVEFVTEIEPDIFKFEEIKNSLKNKYKEYFNITLDDVDMLICDGSGIGESGKYEGKYKNSYHVVVNNGYFFKNNYDLKKFVQFIGHEDIDIAVYGGNQNFKLPYQSKFGSIRQQKPINGTFKDHLIGKYENDHFIRLLDIRTECKTSTSNDTIKKINEKKYTNTSVEKYDIGPTNDIVDLVVDINDLKSLMNALGSEIGYNSWICCMCIWKNEGYTLDDFIEWSNSSTKHNDVDEECTRIWNKTKKKTEKCFTINTLLKLLKRKYPKARVFKTYVKKLVDEVSEPTISFKDYGYQTKIYNKKYCEDLCEDFSIYEDIILHSHLGTGKSTAICELVRKMGFRSILCITPRRAFAESIYSDLKKAQDKFVLYKDVKKDERIDCDFIVCQLESLCTVKDKFDLVIFDECESNLAQFDSSTINNLKETTDHFKKIMNNSKNIIWSDAFIMDRSLTICHMLRPTTKKLYIKNEFQPYDRKASEVATSTKDFNDFFIKFKRDNPNDRNVIATGSKINSFEIKDILNETTDGRHNTLLINASTSDDVTKKMRDVNKLWDKYQNVIYTTSITVGISYDSEKVFDNLMLHFSACSSTVRDLFQSSLRARNIKNNVLYYSRYSHFQGEHRFTEFQRKRLRNIIMNRDLKEAEEEHLDDWLIELWVYNKQEQNVNAFFHYSVLEKYLIMCGYKTDDKFEKEKKTKKEEEEEEEIGKNEYETIEEIDFELYKTIDGFIKNGDADEDMKKQHKKFIFDEYILCKNDEIDMCYKREMFDTYITNGNKIDESRKNMTYELKYEINEQLKINVSHYKDNIKEKLDNLKVIKQLLGIKYTFDRGEVKREKMKPLGDYLQKNLQDLKEIWGLDLRNFKKSDKFTDKVALGIINQIWSRWGFNKIKRDKEKKKQVKGVVTDVSDFNMNPSDKYILFDYCFDKTEYTEENDDEMG